MPTPDSKRSIASQTRDEAGSSMEPHWRGIDISSFEYLQTPFKWIQEEITNLQNQFFWLEHITRGVSKALDNCGPKNILRELAKKTNRLIVDALEIEKAQLTAQVVAMTQELTQKNEEIRRYQAEQMVVLNQVRDLVGNPGEIVNKAHLYNKLVETAEPSSAK